MARDFRAGAKVDDWLLGHQIRSALPDELVRFLDGHSQGVLAAITWIEPQRLRFTAHYTKDGQPLEERIFKYRPPSEQSRRRRTTGTA
jgi:hypothetical protein